MCISVESDGRQLLLASACSSSLGFSLECLLCRTNLKEVLDKGDQAEEGEHEGKDGEGCRAAVAALYCATLLLLLLLEAGAKIGGGGRHCNPAQARQRAS